MQELLDIIDGSLLGDGSVQTRKNKYHYFNYTAKDKKFLENLKKIFEKYRIRCWITENNPDVYQLGFYINTCPYKKFMTLRERWYKRENGNCFDQNFKRSRNS